MIAKEILVIDNDVMVSLFHSLYRSNKVSFSEVMRILGIKYSRIWIPQTVRQEFLLKRNDRRRKKLLSKIKQDYQFLTDCPIKVGINEIYSLVGNKEENNGEADAILQSMKAKSSSDYKFKDIYFLSNDKAAIQNAKNNNLSTIWYKDFKLQIREIGVIIPS